MAETEDGVAAVAVARGYVPEEMAVTEEMARPEEMVAMAATSCFNTTN